MAVPGLAVLWRGLEIVSRNDDSPSTVRSNQVRCEPGCGLDVDVLCASGQGGLEDAETLLFRSPEPPTLPLRPASDDHGTAASVEGRRDVRVVDLVEAELDQVGVGRVTCGAHLSHGGSRYRRTEQGFVVHSSHSPGTRIGHSQTALIEQ